MKRPTEYSYQRYLTAKKTVDDRALNHRVLAELAGQMDARAVDGRPFTVLEIGAGVGTMVERLAERDLLPQSTIYTALDSSRDNITRMGQEIPHWASDQGFEIEQDEKTLTLIRGDQVIKVIPQLADIRDFFVDFTSNTYDLLIANAVLDLIDYQNVLPHLFRLITPGGLFYFSINFDGATILEPAIDDELDERIQHLYHHTMDTRIIDDQPSGDSRTGRHLLTYLQQAPVEILEAGSSDWMVFSRRGTYLHDEAYFLHFIVNTIGSALAGHSELKSDVLLEWVEARHRQVERGELIYIAHQLDVLGYTIFDE